MKAFVEKIISLFLDDEVIKWEAVNRVDHDDHRYIFIIETRDEGRVVAKCYCNGYNTAEKVGAYADLSKKYRESGLVTPLFYATTQGDFYIKLMHDQRDYLVWLEEHMDKATLSDEGKSFADLDGDLVYQLGCLRGKMHRVARDNEIKFPWYFTTILYHKFASNTKEDQNYNLVKQLYEALKGQAVDQDSLTRIWQLYHQKRDETLENYGYLPNGASQADFGSLGNILVDDGLVYGVLDFNMAHNDVFLTEMMQEAIFLSYETSLKENPMADDRFLQYCKGYLENYALNRLESNKINLFYNLMRPFTYEKINKVLNLVKENKFALVNEQLEWMLRELERNIDIVD